MTEEGLQLTTPRLVLIAATPTIAGAELHDRARFAELLGARVSTPWPPPLNDEESIAWTVQLLEMDPKSVGWGPWYFVLVPPGAPRIVIGNGGFKGRATADGTVEVGYSIVEEYQRRGYAPEAVDALVRWAFSHDDVRRVVAQTMPDLRGSIRVLEKCGFAFIGPGFEEGAILFERLRLTERVISRIPDTEVVNLKQKLALFEEHWSPKIVGELNGQQVKVVKLKGEFVWHHHDEEDELFLVVRGTLRMKLRDRDVTIREGEFLVVPRGVEHLPIADEECHVVLFEPASTLNTGDVKNERTVERLERL